MVSDISVTAGTRVFGRLPLSNIVPFTYRDGLTYADLLYQIRDRVNNTFPAEMQELLNGVIAGVNEELREMAEMVLNSEKSINEAYTALAVAINAKIDAINNKTGAVDIQRYVVGNSFALTVDPTWPTNQPVRVVLTQDAEGGRGVLVDPSIRGELDVDKSVNGVTEFDLIPQGGGSWEIRQESKILKDSIYTAVSPKAERVLIGANIRSDSTDPHEYFGGTRKFEKEFNTTFDIVPWYRAVGEKTADSYRDEIGFELRNSPDRKIMYALEIWRNNADFISEMDSKTGIYPYLVNLFTAIKETGHMERVYLAPFHEGNAGGNYPWEMYYVSKGNTPELYKAAFKKVVDLARKMGVTSKIIQWFLTSNSATNSPDPLDLEAGYVGDDFVDLIGVSYYNRSEATGYSSTWTPVGASLRTFVNTVERFTENDIWICETGCAASNNGHDKGVWYAGLIDLLASGELPRVTALIMFLVQGTTTDMRLENVEQKRRLARSMNRAGRAVAPEIPHGVRGLIPPAISIPANKAHWTEAHIDGLTPPTLRITTNHPEWLGSDTTSLRVTKPEAQAIQEGYGVYCAVAAGDVDFVIGQPYTLTFAARASYDNFRVFAGIRQFGGSNRAGDRALPISTQWEKFTVPFATTTESNGTWRLPYFAFGDNLPAGWIEFTDIQLVPGHLPQPNTRKLEAPKVLEAVDKANVSFNCDSADVWNLRLTGNRTLDKPIGSPFDGQEIHLRVTQDSVGGRTLTRGVGFYQGEPLTLTVAPYSLADVTLRYYAAADLWAVVHVARLNFT